MTPVLFAAVLILAGATFARISLYQEIKNRMNTLEQNLVASLKADLRGISDELVAARGERDKAKADAAAALAANETLSASNASLTSSLAAANVDISSLNAQLASISAGADRSDVDEALTELESQAHAVLAPPDTTPAPPPVVPVTDAPVEPPPPPAAA